MKAAYITIYGRDSRLVIGDVAEPTVGDKDILVEIHAASLNPIDFKLRNGMLRLFQSYKFPLVLGHDCEALEYSESGRARGKIIVKII